jgi:hypothetical protein
MIEIGPDNRCPVCGRYMKKAIESATRTTWECSNTKVDHEWDEG